MAYGILTQQWGHARQPGPTARIDWTNPITRGLTAVILPSISQTELIYRVAPTVGGTAPVKSVDEFGASVDSLAADGHLVYDAADGRWASPSQTHFVIFEAALTSAPWLGILGTADSSGVSNSFALQRYSTGTGLVIFTNAGDASAYQFGSINDLASGERISLSMSGRSGSTVARVVRNGRLYATPTLTAAPQERATSRLLTLGVRDSLTAYNIQGRWYIRLAWNRQLSFAEDASLHEYPWQIFEPDDTPVFYSLGGAAGAPVLSLPGVTGITATGATPKVTVTFS